MHNQTRYILLLIIYVIFKLLKINILKIVWVYHVTKSIADGAWFCEKL